MLYNGERIGDGTPPEADIAVDPIDGTTLTALGRGNAIAVIAVSERGTMYDPGPCVYMEKIAVGPEAAHAIDITATPTENLNAVAKALGKRVTEVTAVVLDRPRHEELIGEIIGLLQSPIKNVISGLQGSGGQKIAGLLKTLENRAQA